MFEKLSDLFQALPSDQAKQSLEIPHVIDRILGFPTIAYPTIHVAGSNGKGSVALKIAKALELCGYRVGLYTSPHLFTFRERVAINGELISEEDFESGLEKLFALKLEATFFDLMTFLAFDYFRTKAVDVAVIETGLGGRYDATNVVRPILSVITSISLEHAHVLGKEIELIAAEKAGIIKENVPIVIGPKARCRSIHEKAKEMHSPVFASNKISYFYDEENSAVAELALEQLHSHFTLERGAIAEGLAARPPCRFEQQGHVIFDVAHNPEAIFCLLQGLHTFFPEGKFRFLVGFSKDKDYARCLELIAQVATQIHLVEAPSSRAAAVEELASSVENSQLCVTHASIQQGVEQAYAEALAKDEILVICGSFYIMAEARSCLTQTV